MAGGVHYQIANDDQYLGSGNLIKIFIPDGDRGNQGI